MTKIEIVRENEMKHLAIICGINFFWIIIFRLLLSCCVKNQFTSSLRATLDPEAVKRADEEMNANPISMFRRKYCSQVPGLALRSQEEVQLD